MSEYSHVEKPFLDQLAALDWAVIKQCCRVTMQSRASEESMGISVRVRRVDHDA